MVNALAVHLYTAVVTEPPNNVTQLAVSAEQRLRTGTVKDAVVRIEVH